MEVKLTKAWKNHPAGTVIESVSDSIMKDLKRLGVIKTGRKRSPKKTTGEKTKSVIFPANKMISQSPEKKEEGEAKSPSYLKEK